MGVPIGGTTDTAKPLVVGTLDDTTGPTSESEPAAFFGAFNAALSAEASFVGTIVFEKSYDGGVTWITVSRDVTGTAASYSLNWASPTSMNLTLCEVEPQVAWRVRCTAWTSGALVYRMSQGGGLYWTGYPGMGGML